MTSIQLDEMLDFAISAAREAGRITLEFFQTGLAVQTKGDNSPVTMADLQGEQKLRELIGSRYPEHDIVGEEFGQTERNSRFRWILDPIDGTQSFIRGVGMFGVLIGLELDGKPVLGVAHFPALNETVYAAAGLGCYWNGRRARVSEVTNLADAALMMTDLPSLYQYGRGDAYERLSRSVRFQRTWGDCYGHMLVATGRAEIMLDPIMNVWDCAPLLPILQEAGGTFTDWNGVATIRGGNALSTNGFLFDQVRELIVGAS
jgi:histidinol phosphatase-like enzyme (inositol monophosphatase family)